MKRFYFLLISFLTLSFIVIAQVKMFVHQSNGNIVEILASRVDSISLLFPSKEEPDDPDVPVEPVFYTISFDANGGTGTLSSEELEENKTYVIPSNVFIREGYKFIGWNTKADGTGTIYTPGQSLTPTENITLYAKWEEKNVGETIVLRAEQIENTGKVKITAEYSITPTNIVWLYKTEGGEYTEIEGENTNVLIFETESSKYTYVKAYILNEFGEKIESEPIIINTSCLSVVFIDDFGTFTNETDRAQTPYIGREYTYVPGCEPLREEGTYAVMVNPKFAGDDLGYGCHVTSESELWYRDIYDHTQGRLIDNKWGGLLMVNADADLVYSREVVVPSNTFMTYSAWAAYASDYDGTNSDAYFESAITFVVRGGHGGNLVEMQFNLEDGNDGWQKGEVAFNTEENTRVTIELYNYNKGGLGNDFVIDDISFSICDEANVGIVAPVSISFNANGGLGNMNTEQINPLVYYTLPANTFIKENYFFTGWNTKADGTGESFTDVQSIYTKESLTLYAQWVKGVTVSFNANGGNGAMNSMLINPTKSFKIPTNTFTNEDNFCKGWNTKADGTGIAYAGAQTISITESVTLYAQWEKLITTGIENGHGYVDLGLPSGLKWATMNVGAESPEDYGDYFAWGETESKSTYNWETYKWCDGSSDTMTKYCTSSSYGTVDNKATLDLADDAANVNWGGDWRMPTKAEQDELRSECTWTRGTLNGVQGYKVTSKSNDNSIFLPAAGVYRSYLYNAGSVGYYWSSSLYTYYSEDAYYLYLLSNSVSSSGYYRDYGCSVRPVSYIKLSFPLMFSGNGGKGTMPTIKAKEDEQISIPSSTYTRLGYEFVGWNTKADGSGAFYTAGESLTLTTDLTLYAQWKEIIKYYTLSFNANGGNGSMNSIELEEGKNFTIPSNPFTRTDYEFIGWNTKADGSGASYTAGESLTLTTDLTLYAQWEKLVNSKLYFVNTDNWSGVNAYVWIDETSKEYIEWPGEEATRENITKYGYSIYSYNMYGKEQYNMIIFNEESSSLKPGQTDDLIIDYSKPYFYKGIWYKSLDDIVDTETDTDNDNEHDYVDLGLPSGTKWATMNVGADSPEEYGDYFAWGETTTKSTYNWSTYKWCQGSSDTMTKYCTSSSYGTVDNNIVLDLEDDAAYVNWGSSWRMPTGAEQDELSNTSYTTWTLTTQNGVKGYKVTSKINGNSIFLPAPGFRDSSGLYDKGFYGGYWSSSLDASGSDVAYYLYFDSGSVGSNHIGSRNYGRSVRPVLRDVEFTFTIMFDGNEGEGTMPAIDGQHDDRVKIPASTFTREGYYFASWNTKADGTGTSYKVGDVITQAEDLTLYAQWKLSSGTSNGYTWIDLGLPSGTKWAITNVGASTADEYGNYYAWGETEPKETYDWSTYKWCKGTNTTQTKYCTNSRHGIVDNKTTLDLSDDAAYVNWGTSWRMPTIVEQNELSNTSYTTWTWTTQNGVKGYKVTSKTNGNSIFLPAAGYHNDNDLGLHNAGSGGHYWSSSLSTHYWDKAYSLRFISYRVYSDYYSRYYGQSVRPVLRDVEFSFTIMFDGNGGEGTMPAIDVQHDDRVKVPASTFTREGYYFASWNTKADGTGTSYKVGEAIMQAEDITLYAQWKLSSGTSSGYTWIDLGLPSGTKWATTNVGATTPEGYGNYYAWGETTPKSTYSWSTYKWYNGSYDTMTKYCTSSSYGTVDNKTILDLSDDAAYVNWSSSWRMPTYAEQDELRNTNYTTWTWTTQNGVNGYKVTSNVNGNSIFLPAAGYRNDLGLNNAGSYGGYWSSSLMTFNSDYAYYLYFNSDDVSSYYRVNGQSVRPVLHDVEFTFTIMFDGNGGEGTMPAIDGQHDDRVKIPASTFTREGYYVASWNTKADGTGTSYNVGEVITQAEDLILYAQWEESKESGAANGYAWVDLGLPSGTKWATMNVGADSPEEYGDYFAWGETTTKSSYESSNYNYSSTPTTLPLDTDAAYTNWGKSWRMPTKAEQDELRNTSYTTWTLTTQNGVKGYKVTSKINDNSIFLPTAGFRYGSYLYNAGSSGYYWSSSLNTIDSYDAYFLIFGSDGVGSSDDRYFGRTVRPVLCDVEFTIMFDGNGGEGTMPAIEVQHDDRVKIPASTFTREGYYVARWNTKADGTGTSYKVGDAITEAEDLTLYAQWKPLSGTSDGYTWIDLGLPSGTRWAATNVGATTPEGYGNHYAWGETTPKSTYNLSTYKWCKGSSYTMTKYCTSSSYGTVDNKTILDLSDDAAYVNWGASWRMPTRTEQDELRNTNYTTWTWTTQNGVKGYKVTSKINGNSIFLPAAGYHYYSDSYYAGSNGYYLSSSLNTSNSSYAYELYFLSDLVDSSVNGYRYYGQSVRPVLRVELSYNTISISFDANGGTGTMSAMSYEKGERKVLTANKFTRTGYIFKGWNTKSDGTGTSYTEGQTISLTKNTTLYAQWEKFNITGTANGHDYVDLGLPSGTLWATCNVGADSPEEYGDYFAWGETTTKSSYENSNYNYSSTPTTLPLDTDAAYTNWGSSWRMPTDAEFKELKDNCIWTWTTQNGVSGYKVTSKVNGNSIFLPAAGYRYYSDLSNAGSYGCYWSSSLTTSNSDYAYDLYFFSDLVLSYVNSRYYGQPVRPVLAE